MRTGRSRAPLALMEQIIMILVFALAAAVCLQAFVYADSLSKEGAQEVTAVNHAQEVTECVKSVQGDMDEACRETAGTHIADGICVDYPDDQMCVLLTVTEYGEWLTKALVKVQDRDGQTIYSMQTAWQTEKK